MYNGWNNGSHFYLFDYKVLVAWAVAHLSSHLAEAEANATSLNMGIIISNDTKWRQITSNIKEKRHQFRNRFRLARLHHYDPFTRSGRKRDSDITENGYQKLFTFSGIRWHLFYLLDLVTCQSQKLGFVKEIVQTQISEKCIHFCINEELHFDLFAQFFANIITI